jgi:hypothetical protein
MHSRPAGKVKRGLPETRRLARSGDSAANATGSSKYASESGMDGAVTGCPLESLQRSARVGAARPGSAQTDQTDSTAFAGASGADVGMGAAPERATARLRSFSTAFLPPCVALNNSSSAYSPDLTGVIAVSV